MIGYLRFLSVTLLVSLSLVAAGWLAAWRLAGVRIFSVQSGSMAPVFARGDLLIDLRPAGLHVGDIVSYASQIHPGETVSHRITGIDGGSIITKGDNLPTPDPPVGRQMLRGRAIAALPLAGYALDWLRRPYGLLAVVYLPALIITAGELWRLTGELGYRSYRFTKTA